MISSKIFLVYCIVAYSLLLRFVNGDKVEELVKLVLAQESVMHAMESYVTVEVDRLSTLLGYLERFKHERDKAMADPLKYTGNPLNCFLLIKSLTTDLEFTKKLIGAKRELKLDREWTHPRREELRAAARGVGRLRQTRGLLTGSLTSLMSSSDCLELGRILYEERQYEAAGAWLLESYSRADPVQVEVPTSSADTLQLLGLVFVKLKLGDAKDEIKSSRMETNK